MAMITQASTERVLYMRTNQQTIMIKEGSYTFIDRSMQESRSINISKVYSSTQSTKSKVCIYHVTISLEPTRERDRRKHHAIKYNLED